MESDAAHSEHNDQREHPKRRRWSRRRFVIALCCVAGVVAVALVVRMFLVNRPTVSGWQTYKSSALPVTFDYPKGWTAQEISQDYGNSGVRTMVIMKDGDTQVAEVGYIRGTSGALNVPACEATGSSSDCVQVKSRYGTGYVTGQSSGNYNWLLRDNDNLLSVGGQHVDWLTFIKIVESVRP